MAPSKKHLVAAAAATLITATSLAFSTPAYADPPPADGADASTLEGQIAAKQSELSQINEEYLDAKLALEDQNEAKAAADAQLAVVEAELTAAQAEIAEMGAEAYKSGSLSASVYLLSGESPAQFIERASQQAYVAAYHDSKIGQLAAAEQSVQAVKDDAAAAQAAAAETEQTIAQKKATLESEIPKLEEQLQSLTSDQQAALDAQSGEAAADNGATGDAGAAVTGSAAAVVSWALAQQGKPYSWGGTGPGSFDCSGLTLMAFKQAGLSLPHSSGAQAGMGTSVPMSALVAGDLLYMSGHVGIYIGDGMAVHAPTFGQSVTTITASYFSGARRLL